MGLQAAGAFALSENNLYNTNAFVDYLWHLTDNVVMSFTRSGFDPARESLRIVALARVALEQLVQTDASRPIAMVREDLNRLQSRGAQDTILVARHAFPNAARNQLPSAIL